MGLITKEFCGFSFWPPLGTAIIIGLNCNQVFRSQSSMPVNATLEVSLHWLADCSAIHWAKSWKTPHNSGHKTRLRVSRTLLEVNKLYIINIYSHAHVWLLGYFVFLLCGSEEWSSTRVIQTNPYSKLSQFSSNNFVIGYLSLQVPPAVSKIRLPSLYWSPFVNWSSQCQ